MMGCMHRDYEVIVPKKNKAGKEYLWAVSMEDIHCDQEDFDIDSVSAGSLVNADDIRNGQTGLGIPIKLAGQYINKELRYFNGFPRD